MKPAESHRTDDENEERARMAFDAARMGAFDYDLAADCTKFFGNFHSLFGWTEDRQRSNREIMQAIHADDRPRMEKEAILAIGSASTFDLEYRVVWPDGSVHWIHQKARVLCDQAGVPARMVGVAMDIDDRKRAEQERERLDARVQQVQKLETLGTLAGGVAHDFNNLLQAILGNALIIRQCAGAGVDVLESLEQIEIACQRASELTNQLLAYAGKGSLVVEAVDLSQLAMEMSKLLESSLPQKPRLHGQFTPGLPAIGGDATQLRQVVMNLVINAAESQPEPNGVIQLSTGAVDLAADELSALLLGNGLPAGKYVYFEVCDMGCGMTEEVRTRIFDPFFTTKQSGRGLGLAAVLGIVRGHRGALLVHSEAGSGTLIRVLFPASSKPHPASRPAAPRQQPIGERKSGTILVVDDEEAIRTSARFLLESLGFSVLMAGNGLEALETFKARQSEISAVLLDLSMPKMSGVEALRGLRLLRPDLPILVTSGFSERESVKQFQDDGLIGFIQKPYRGSELRTRLLELLKRATENGHSPRGDLAT